MQHPYEGELHEKVPNRPLHGLPSFFSYLCLKELGWGHFRSRFLHTCLCRTGHVPKWPTMKKPMAWVGIIPIMMGTRSCAHPSFGMTPTFPKKKKIKIYFSFESWCHTKRRAGAAPRAHPSFGMTPTRDIRDTNSRPWIHWKKSLQHPCEGMVFFRSYGSALVISRVLGWNPAQVTDCPTILPGLGRYPGCSV